MPPDAAAQQVQPFHLGGGWWLVPRAIGAPWEARLMWLLVGPIPWLGWCGTLPGEPLWARCAAPWIN